MLLCPELGWAQKYSNEFLSIGVGARAQALGNSVVALTDDVYAGVWNPAGLASTTQDAGLQIGAMHAEWFAGVGKFDYIGISVPLAKPQRRVALSVIRFGIDAIPNTLSLYESDGSINFDNLSEFSAADYAFMGSYAQPLSVRKGTLLVGGNVKVVRRIIGPFANAWGFGLDLGLQYGIGKWQFGLVARDVTSTFNAWAFNFTDAEKATLQLTNNEIPISSVEVTKPQIVLGAARRLQFNNIGVRPEINFTVTTDGQRNTLISSDPFSIDPSMGVEADFKRFVFLRLGVGQFQELSDFGGQQSLIARPSLGVGLKISSLNIDYAFTNPGNNEGRYSHIISLMLAIKPKVKV